MRDVHLWCSDVDGFTIAFFQAHWSIVKNDIMKVSLSSVSEPSQREIPEENAHKKTQGEWPMVKSEPTSEKYAVVLVGRDPAEVEVESRL